MAVYTHIDDRMLGDLLAGFDIGRALSFKGIAEGVENSNYFLETETGRFILTLYEKRVSAGDLPYFLGLMDHLSSRGLPVPKPVADRGGRVLRELAGRPAAIISFLDGISVAETTPPHCTAVGASLARLHRDGADFTLPRTNDLSLDGWHALAEKTRARADEVEPGLARFIGEELRFLHDHWPDGLPVGTIHADLFPDNVLFTGNTVTGLIDFYFACTDMLAYDVAVTMNAWCFDAGHRFVPARAKALIEQYDMLRGLEPAELDALPVLARGGALRFLLTRLHDWLFPVTGALVRPKDPREYLARIRYHRTVRDAADYVV